MLLGIINDTTNKNNYYINYKDNEVNIVKVNNNSINSLDKEEIRNLIKTLLSSKLTYLEKYNDYDVYIDEANNKRYYKNGIEDIFMFLNNNGVSAINCLGNSKASSKIYKLIVSTIVFEIILSSTVLIPFVGDPTIRKKIDTSISYINKLTSDELINSIETSKYLSEEDKKLLSNEAYFNFMLEYSDPIRNYSIRNCFDNVNIKTFTSEEVPNADGYYDPLNPNTIYILKKVDNNPYYTSIATHEFIHLTQAQNKYAYIKETATEIIKREFYNESILDYQPYIIRLKALMEIIGSETIAECNYKGDTDSFEKAINKYLNPEEAKQLLELFTTSAVSLNDPNFNGTELNSKIDNYIAKMYYNKTGKDINDDLMMKAIYSDKANNRVYFNNTLDNYYNDFYLTTDKKLIEETNVSDIVNSDRVEKYIYNSHEAFESNGTTTIRYTTKTTKDFSEIPLEPAQFINVYFKDGTIGYAYYDESKNQWNTLRIYKIIEITEPSIPRKFPDQVKNSYIIESEVKVI